MNRFELNGDADTIPVGKAKPRRRRAASTTGAARPKSDPLTPWAYAGIALSITLSGVLNGYANALHAPVAWAGWVLGLWIPTLVLVFARLGGVCYARGWRTLGLTTGAVVLALLALSVSHCAESIGLLTGATGAHAVLMAIGIDAGLVCCELATVTAKRK